MNEQRNTSTCDVEAATAELDRASEAFRAGGSASALVDAVDDFLVALDLKQRSSKDESSWLTNFIAECSQAIKTSRESGQVWIRREDLEKLRAIRERLLHPETGAPICGDKITLNGVDWICTKPADHRDHERHPNGSATSKAEALRGIGGTDCVYGNPTCPRCHQTMPAGDAVHTDHCPALKTGAPICPECKTELAFEGDVCGLCFPVAQP
jgi:hypothetical protein